MLTVTADIYSYNFTIMRMPMIAGNWKMNTTLADAHLLANGVVSGAEHMEHCEIVLCPPSIWLTEVAHIVPPREFPRMRVGAQNMYCETKGAFTGEISPLMVREVAEYVILGHSERVHVFKEGPELISNKVHAAFANGITPILCVGEEVQGGDSVRHLAHSLDYLLRGVEEDEIAKLVLAYEPVWAIGTGVAASPEYAQEVIATLRSRLSVETRILYGGSVSAENAAGFLAHKDIDGFLIGGASLKIKDFLVICQLADDNAASKTHN
jgi:triosephosphate isomerase